ncbi:MAG: 30S ribosome-binding factor RbfA [Chloroflexi bacterium]|nr:30S ribosome-binding factor RbfA [Chloroflexota bacterium]
MLNYRRERASSFIQEEMALLLRGSVDDPAVQALTITDVDLTQDRRLARIYVACYTGEEDLKKGLRGLERAKGFLRHALSEVLAWPFTPEIEFRVDRSWERSARIDELFAEIAREHEEPKDEAAD